MFSCGSSTTNELPGVPNGDPDIEHIAPGEAEATPDWREEASSVDCEPYDTWSGLEITTMQVLDLFVEDPQVSLPRSAAYYEKMAPRADYGTGDMVVHCSPESVCVLLVLSVVVALTVPHCSSQPETKTILGHRQRSGKVN